MKRVFCETGTRFKPRLDLSSCDVTVFQVKRHTCKRVEARAAMPQSPGRMRKRSAEQSCWTTAEDQPRSRSNPRGGRGRVCAGWVRAAGSSPPGTTGNMFYKKAQVSGSGGVLVLETFAAFKPKQNIRLLRGKPVTKQPEEVQVWRVSGPSLGCFSSKERRCFRQALCKARKCSEGFLSSGLCLIYKFFAFICGPDGFHSPVNGCGTALHWFLIQIFSRSYSSAAPALFGVPQASILEALWLSLYLHHHVPLGKTWRFIYPLCWW